MKKINNFLIKFLVLLVFCLILSILLLITDTIFTVLTPPMVISISLEPENQEVLLDSTVIIKFNKPIKRQEIQPFIFPEVYGEWKFKDPLFKNHFFKTLIFTPAINFKPDTLYLVKIENIKGFGLDKSTAYQYSFKTQSLSEIRLPDAGKNKKEISLEQLDKSSEIHSPEAGKNKKDEAGKNKKEIPPKQEVTILEIPLDWQDYPLSCEAASLKMALAGKGIYVSEDEIMKKIGFDLTPRKKNIWGDPNKTYVGKIDGKMCQTGYGVYWDPVAKVAQNFRPAETFSNWRIEDLTKEISLGNPVIVWGVLPTGNLTDCSWYTLEGKYIKAFKETHVRLAIGFIGSPENPSKIILNDPLAGRIYWKTSYFLKNWEVFNYSGVVVR